MIKNTINGVLAGKNAKIVPVTTNNPILIIKIFCGVSRDNILPAINDPTIQKIELGVVANPAKVAGNPKIPCVHDGTYTSLAIKKIAIIPAAKF